MKTCAIGLIVENKIASIDECLNFAWSQPISIAISGMDHYDHLKHNVELARNFKQMSDQDLKTLYPERRTCPARIMSGIKLEIQNHGVCIALTHLCSLI